MEKEPHYRLHIMRIEVTVLHKLVRITSINNENIGCNEFWFRTCNCWLYLIYHQSMPVIYMDDCRIAIIILWLIQVSSCFLLYKYNTLTRLQT